MDSEAQVTDNDSIDIADGLRHAKFRNPAFSLMSKAADALDAQAAHIAELEAVLGEARLQIEYLQEKFQPTGTGNAVLARINAALAPR